MSLWTSDAAIAATGGQSTADWTASGVSIDTRTLEPGDLFVALTAARDGHDFVAQALQQGAAAALVSRVPEGVAADAPLLIVDDVLAGLEALGRAARARTSARVAAVTGSVGKTSTKEMLRTILSAQGRTHVSAASYNNHWGVPLTLARMPEDTEYAVIEIGMNHPGEIAPLARMARPHVAMITTVAAVHLEAFDDVQGIALEKAAILDGLEPGGIAVLNNDCDMAAILQAKADDVQARSIGFGLEGFDFKVKSLRSNADGSVVDAEAGMHSLLYKIHAPGEHFAINGLGALATATALGADLALSAAALGRWTPFVGRGQRERILLDLVETDLAIDLIDDSYNANPTSVGAALDVLAIAPVAKGRRIAVLGDMKELGDTSAALHAGLADHRALEAVDIVHCIGPDMAHLHTALPEAKRGLHRPDAASFAAGLSQHLRAGDVVMVKGSLSMKLALVVDAIRKMGHPQGLETDAS